MDIHSLLKIEYEKRRMAAEELAARRRQEIYLKIPRIKEIDDEVRLEGIRHNRLILMNPELGGSIPDVLTSKLAGLKEERTRLLCQNGYPPDYLEPEYKCGTCRDTGFIRNEEGTVRCCCYNQQLVELLYANSNLKLIEKENFEYFDESLYSAHPDEERYGIKKSPRENILGIKDKCLKFIDRFESAEEKNLYFTGPTGVGKTFMTNCIAREILCRGWTVIYLTAPALFDIITYHKMAGTDRYEENAGMYESIFTVNLLIIDDLGTESRTASRWAELLNILNTRYLNNLSSPCKTIISTNTELEELFEYYSERVESRIVGSFSIYRFAGDDIRKLKR